MAMDDKQLELYYQLDAWRMQRANMLAGRSTRDEQLSQFNELLSYMRELASVGMPDDAAAQGEFDVLLTEIRLLLPIAAEQERFDEAWDMLDGENRWVPMDERYGVYARDDEEYDAF